MSARVLVVEDDLALRPLWELVLKRQFVDYHLDWAISCEEAQRFLTSSIKYQSPYSLIITDLFLAGSGTGLDLIRFKGQIHNTIPLILVSVAEDTLIKENFNKVVSSTTVLTKPLSVPQLDRALEKIFAPHVRQESS
ncbi:hypothetical protein [Bdellovibrio sp. HCB2-146]|uniref:hypothetical protein n=1 Tax=Bdellovibrio sp. HCB2-146 TaxID=3394362 RepID=UPI0039BD3360